MIRRAGWAIVVATGALQKPIVFEREIIPEVDRESEDGLEDTGCGGV